jgi:hypothetical protein
LIVNNFVFSWWTFSCPVTWKPHSWDAICLDFSSNLNNLSWSKCVKVNTKL